MFGQKLRSLLIEVLFLSELDEVKGTVVDEKGDGPNKLDHASGILPTLSAKSFYQSCKLIVENLII